jgi:uncharacterized membrane protein (UPF0127 family)
MERSLKLYAGGKLIADHVKAANTFWERFVGLMGKKQLNSGEGLLLYHCSSIHCFFMRFPIDVVYLSSDNKILEIETVKPWRIGRIVRGAKHVLELPAGAADRAMIGEALKILE